MEDNCTSQVLSNTIKYPPDELLVCASVYATSCEYWRRYVYILNNSALDLYFPENNVLKFVNFTINLDGWVNLLFRRTDIKYPNLRSLLIRVTWKMFWTLRNDNWHTITVHYNEDTTMNKITRYTSILAKNKMLCMSSDISRALRGIFAPEVTVSCSSYGLVPFGRLRSCSWATDFAQV